MKLTLFAATAFLFFYLGLFIGAAMAGMKRHES